MQFAYQISRSCVLRTIVITIGILLFGNYVTCQKIVSEFNIIDSEGNSHALYEDYLEKGKIVVLDLFFTDCPPCNTMAPFIKASYEKWGNGQELVQFISLSPVDNNEKINSFKEIHQLIHPASGIEGGGDVALEQFINDLFGQFFGYPVLVLVKPNGEVIFDIHSTRGDKETIDLLNFHIENEIRGEIADYNITMLPNPSVGPGILNILVPDDASFELSIFDINGKMQIQGEYTAQNAGIYNFEHLISDFSSGMYFVSINVNGEQLILRKIIIL